MRKMSLSFNTEDPSCFADLNDYVPIEPLTPSSLDAKDSPMRSASTANGGKSEPIPIPQADADVDSMRRSMRELQEVCDDDSVYFSI
jgi:hypothetical protein